MCSNQGGKFKLDAMRKHQDQKGTEREFMVQWFTSSEWSSRERNEDQSWTSMSTPFIFWPTLFPMGRSHETFHMAAKQNTSSCKQWKISLPSESPKGTEPCRYPRIWSCRLCKGPESQKARCQSKKRSICRVWFRIQGVQDLLAWKEVDNSWA